MLGRNQIPATTRSAAIGRPMDGVVLLLGGVIVLVLTSEVRAT
jgi:hypothetical protein